MCDYTKLFISSLGKYNNHKKWENGLYGGIKTISNTHVGSVGQDFVENLCCDLGFKCDFPLNKSEDRANQSPWDISIDGIKFELKTATEDVGGAFQFNHIRYHRPYDAALCLGVSPNELYFNLWTKEDLVTGRAGKLVSMESGANASYKLTKRPSELYTINNFEEILREFIKTYFHTHIR